MHISTHRIQCDPTLFCEQVLPFVARKASWLDIWKTYSDVVENHIDSLAEGKTEPGLFRFLHHHLPAHYALFLSNSMPVRDANSFFFPRFYRAPIFGNRGLSGIDGNIATAIGLAQGAQRPLLAVLGDLAALHDLNSLAQIKKAKAPVIFLVINNQGGAIFHFLPIAQKKDVLEEFFVGAHDFNFEAAAAMFHIPYHSVTDFSIVSRALKEEKSCILELDTNRVENHALHESIQEKLNKCFTSISCMVS
jgi:2-succinyl-5-enolpyruvyl-6-hydroxy-3-cyclohexene-1-carboxylate synthase